MEDEEYQQDPEFRVAMKNLKDKLQESYEADAEAHREASRGRAMERVREPELRTEKITAKPPDIPKLPPQPAPQPQDDLSKDAASYPVSKSRSEDTAARMEQYGDPEAARKWREEAQKNVARGEAIRAAMPTAQQFERKVQEAASPVTQQSNIQPPPLPKLQQTTPPPQQDQNAFQQFAPLIMALAALGGHGSRRAATASLNAFSEGIKGLKQGQMDVYNQKYQEWKDANNIIIENNKNAVELYNAAMNNTKLTLEERRDQAQIGLQALGQTVAYQTLQLNDIRSADQLMQKIESANTQFQVKLGQMDIQNQRLQMQIQVAQSRINLNNFPVQIRKEIVKKQDDNTNTKIAMSKVDEMKGLVDQGIYTVTDSPFIAKVAADNPSGWEATALREAIGKAGLPLEEAKLDRTIQFNRLAIIANMGLGKGLFGSRVTNLDESLLQTVRPNSKMSEGNIRDALADWTREEQTRLSASENEINEMMTNQYKINPNIFDTGVTQQAPIGSGKQAEPGQQKIIDWSDYK